MLALFESKTYDQSCTVGSHSFIQLSGVRSLKHIELLARSEDAAPLASLRPSKSASPALPEALEFAIRGRSGTALAFETAAPEKHSICQSKLHSHVLRELELENDCSFVCYFVFAYYLLT